MVEEPQVERVLKQDQLGRVELLRGTAGPIVRRVASGSGVLGSRAVARILLARERAALERLAGLAGVARVVEPGASAVNEAYARARSLDGSVPDPRDVLLRTWIEGMALSAASALPRDFFERLAELVCSMHARGVRHNDLHKEANVLVGADGYPALVDFQLASCHARDGLTARSRAREDLRHVAKHRFVYCRMLGSDGGPAVELGRRSWIAAGWMTCVKPVYRRFTGPRRARADGEPRRSLDGPRPRWTEPVGPRAL